MFQFQTPPVFHYGAKPSTGGGKSHVDPRMKEAALTLLSVSPTFAAMPAPKAPLETLCNVAATANAFSLGPAQDQSKTGKKKENVSKGSLWNGARLTANNSKAGIKRGSILKSAKKTKISNSKVLKEQTYFPSTLELKYKPVYNKGGRIGIYDRNARAKLLARWMKKREKRIWVKKVRYGCRKNLAESRVRVKGRFVSSKKQSK